MAKVLLLGGCGFIGRHLVMYLYKNKLASKVCVVDKQLFAMVGLSPEELKVFQNKEFVTFVQADLKNADRVAKAFQHDGGDYKYVINLAAVTKYSQAKAVYDVNVLVAKTVAAEAAKQKVERFVQVSTAQVYKSKPKKPHTETGDVDPWTGLAKAHLEAEKAVAATDGLNYVIVRPANVYGTADTLSLTPRLIIGAIYKDSGKKMESLYSKDFKCNTVHADDAAAALFFLCSKGEPGAIYNLADKNNTDLGKVNAVIEKVYGIKVGFINAMKMKMASGMGTSFLTGFANDTHLKPWSELTKKHGIFDTPLTPYLDEELVLDRQLYIDGSAIEKLGFEYKFPVLKPEYAKEVLEDFAAKGFFPKKLLS